MRRNLRLNRRADFKRVRRFGISFAHPLVVLIFKPNSLPSLRFGFSANRNVGNAVQRNLAKRRLRAIAYKLLPELQSGLDCILLARKNLLSASFVELEEAVRGLLESAGLLNIVENDN